LIRRKRKSGITQTFGCITDLLILRNHRADQWSIVEDVHISFLLSAWFGAASSWHRWCVLQSEYLFYRIGSA
jgi:hypothetical protein